MITIDQLTANEESLKYQYVFNTHKIISNFNVHSITYAYTNIFTCLGFTASIKTKGKFKYDSLVVYLVLNLHVFHVSVVKEVKKRRISIYKFHFCIRISKF